MRMMFDAVTPENIPKDAEIVGGYLNGRYAWSAADWARFPHAMHVRISVRAAFLDGHVLDVERVGHHHIDMARAWMLHGDRAEALAHLNIARRIAPNNTRHHPAVRETVLALAAADRRTTSSLTSFARWSGVRI
jgi:hypothetical protein